jgi:class 3 adenylate cyclase
MSLAEELEGAVSKIFREKWEQRQGSVVPAPEDLRLSNDAVELEGTVLYADISGSTAMVDQLPASLAAEIYKAFLLCAGRIIRAEGGTVTAYDGDRIMAVYVGDSKNTDAARTALKINSAVLKIVNPLYARIYGNSPLLAYSMRHVVAVDTSTLLVARTGFRGTNDLVWVGPAANYAAKMTSLDDAHPSWVSKQVHDQLHESLRTGVNGEAIWELVLWGGKHLYRSKHHWPI